MAQGVWGNVEVFMLVLFRLSLSCGTVNTTSGGRRVGFGIAANIIVMSGIFDTTLQYHSESSHSRYGHSILAAAVMLTTTSTLQTLPHLRVLTPQLQTYPYTGTTHPGP